jgi:hypothetical protein
MASLFADENVPLGLVTVLGNLGRDVLTALAAGRANQKIPDPDGQAGWISRVLCTGSWPGSVLRPSH